MAPDTSEEPADAANPEEVEAWWCENLGEVIDAGMPAPQAAQEFVTILSSGQTSAPADSIEEAVEQLWRLQCHREYAADMADALLGP
jgi:hypothetical protein